MDAIVWWVKDCTTLIKQDAFTEGVKNVSQSFIVPLHG
jgi:hypothetical protein